MLHNSFTNLYRGLLLLLTALLGPITTLCASLGSTPPRRESFIDYKPTSIYKDSLLPPYYGTIGKKQMEPEEYEMKIYNMVQSVQNRLTKDIKDIEKIQQEHQKSLRKLQAKDKAQSLIQTYFPIDQKSNKKNPKDPKSKLLGHLMAHYEVTQQECLTKNKYLTKKVTKLNTFKNEQKRTNEQRRDQHAKLYDEIKAFKDDYCLQKQTVQIKLDHLAQQIKENIHQLNRVSQSSQNSGSLDHLAAIQKNSQQVVKLQKTISKLTQDHSACSPQSLFESFDKKKRKQIKQEEEEIQNRRENFEKLENENKKLKKKVKRLEDDIFLLTETNETLLQRLDSFETKIELLSKQVHPLTKVESLQKEIQRLNTITKNQNRYIELEHKINQQRDMHINSNILDIMFAMQKTLKCLGEFPDYVKGFFNPQESKSPLSKKMVDSTDDERSSSPSPTKPLVTKRFTLPQPDEHKVAKLPIPISSDSLNPMTLPKKVSCSSSSEIKPPLPLSSSPTKNTSSHPNVWTEKQFQVNSINDPPLQSNLEHFLNNLLKCRKKVPLPNIAISEQPPLDMEIKYRSYLQIDKGNYAILSKAPLGFLEYMIFFITHSLDINLPGLQEKGYLEEAQRIHQHLSGEADTVKELVAKYTETRNELQLLQKKLDNKTRCPYASCILFIGASLSIQLASPS